MAKTKDSKTQELFHKTAPEMPEGFYSGDKPNPTLRAFVEQHLRENPYEPANDDYDVPAFDKPIGTTKANAIYNMHTYWSKKPHEAIRQYIRHYTKPGDLVLDTFGGSGSTGLAALMEDRKTIVIDRSPAATFIAKNYCTPVSLQDFQEAFRLLSKNIEAEIRSLYESTCDRCDGKAETVFTVYSQVYQCPRCLRDVALFDCKEVERVEGGKAKKVPACPHCLATGNTEEIGFRLGRRGFKAVLFGYECLGAGKNRGGEPCKPKRATRHHSVQNATEKTALAKDLAKIDEIEKSDLPYEAPMNRMMNCPTGQKKWGLLWRPYHEGVETVVDFFTKRNLWALLCIKQAIPKLPCSQHVKDFLLNGLTAILFKCSKMMGYRDDGIGRVMTGTYWIPQLIKDINVWSYYNERIGDAERHLVQKNIALDGIMPKLIISTESATKLSSIPPDSIDYIFTDPPYSWKVQYGESNFLWEAFLGLDTRWHKDDIIVNEHRNLSEGDWAKLMQMALEECYRVLKPGRWLSLCYHDTSEGTWTLVQDMVAGVGFVVDTNKAPLFIEVSQKSIKQITADKVTKRDLVINFRKPKPGEHRSKVVITGEEDQQTFRQKAQAVIREFLQASPGSTKDRIYDDVVSRLVRKGQMEAHNFDELLREVAEEVKEPVKKNLFENEEPDLLGSHLMGRWHLKESEVGAEDAERATADSAGTRIHDFLAKTTAAKLKESETRISKLQAEIAQRRSKLQAVDQGKSDESRGKLVREIRELTETLDKLTAQRAEWERQALDYSQIFEFYVGAVNPKPKARLEEILEDYCYQTDEGNWRPPLTEPEKKEKGSERQRAVRRKMQRFCNLLEAGGAITETQRPDAPTLAEWLRHCRRTGLHAQGKLLYERGGLDMNALNEQALVDVEEDYQVCVKHLGRSSK